MTMTTYRQIDVRRYRDGLDTKIAADSAAEQFQIYFGPSVRSVLLCEAATPALSPTVGERRLEPNTANERSLTIPIWPALCVCFGRNIFASEMTYIVSGGALNSTHSLKGIYAYCVVE